MAGTGAILLILAILFTAPLVLGSHIVIQGASRGAVLAWLGVLTALLLAGLGVGVVALVALGA